MKKQTAAITGGRFNIDHRVEEKHPSLAGLAATYSFNALGLVPSAQESLRAEVEMGSGSVSPRIPPGRPRTGMKQVRAERTSPRKRGRSIQPARSFYFSARQTP